jgi:hypothetical protein
MTDDQINQAIAAHLGITRKTGIPDFSGDLNEMHEAEKTLFPYYATVYANKLARATKADYSDDTEYFCATARQRAEAFLRTLGKWEEVQG